MAALLRLNPDLYWSTGCGLFEWTLEHVIAWLSNPEAVAELREIVDNKPVLPVG